MPELNMEQTRRQDGEERERGKRALSVLELGPTMAIDGRTFRGPPGRSSSNSERYLFMTTQERSQYNLSESMATYRRGGSCSTVVVLLCECLVHYHYSGKLTRSQYLIHGAKRV